jgi:hypothetical protein
MRKIYRLTEMDFFFQAYVRYKTKIAHLAECANQILCKLSLSFQQSSYSIAEDFHREHSAFLFAFPI